MLGRLIEGLCSMNEEQTYGLTRQLSFRNALLAKLNLIVWAYRGKRPAARKMGIAAQTLFGWFADNTKVSFRRRCARLIDEHYALAFEKRLLKEKKSADHDCPVHD
jgi:hypothetical protein